jgi:hypothetical protein
MRRDPEPACRKTPLALDADMTVRDIADELRRLDFARARFHAVRIDRQVRDYLVVSLLNARHTRRA